MIRLQHCSDCRTVRYPASEFCGVCLSDQTIWDSADSLPGVVVARTLLHHSNEPSFRERLPFVCGLVRFAAGPVAICFLDDTAKVGGAVRVRTGPDGLLIAAPE